MLKKTIFFFTLMAVIIFYGGAGTSSPQEEEVLPQKELYPLYRMQVRMDNPYLARAAMEVKYINNTGRPLEEVVILLPANIIYGERYIEVEGLALRDRPVSLTSTHGRIIVKLDQQLLPGETVGISMNFSTSLPQKAGIFGYDQGVVRLACWHPVLAPFDREKGGWSDFVATSFGDPYYFEAARYQGTFILPPSWQLISPFTTGVKTGEVEREYSFDTKIPARDCTFVLGSRFKHAEVGAGTTKIEYYFLDRDKGFARAGGEILEFFSSWLEDYPYPKLMVVDMPLEENMGMEFAGMIFLSTSFPRIGVQTMAHEIAHQYWYGLVGSHQINEPWVDEGLASYCALLYLEHVQGAGAYDAVFREDPPEFSYISFLPISAYPHKEAYKEAVYTQPVYFWHRMREMAGKERLFQVLGEIQKEYRFQIISGEELFSALKEAYGLDNQELRRILFTVK